MNIRPSSHEIPSPQFSTLTFPSSSSSNSSRAAAGAASHPFHPFSIHSTPLTLEEQQNTNLTFRAIFPFRAPSSASRWVPQTNTTYNRILCSSPTTNNISECLRIYTFPFCNNKSLTASLLLLLGHCHCTALCVR